MLLLLGCISQPQIQGVDYSVNEDQVFLTWTATSGFTHFSVEVDGNLMGSTTDTSFAFRVQSPGQHTVVLKGILPGGEIGDEKTLLIDVPDAPCVPSYSIYSAQRINETFYLTSSQLRTSGQCQVYVNGSLVNPPVELEEGVYSLRFLCEGPFGKRCSGEETLIVDLYPPEVEILDALYISAANQFRMRVVVEDASDVSCTLEYPEGQRSLGKGSQEVVLSPVIPGEEINITCEDILGRTREVSITVG